MFTPGARSLPGRTEGLGGHQLRSEWGLGSAPRRPGGMGLPVARGRSQLPPPHRVTFQATLACPSFSTAKGPLQPQRMGTLPLTRPPPAQLPGDRLQVVRVGSSWPRTTQGPLFLPRRTEGLQVAFPLSLCKPSLPAGAPQSTPGWWGAGSGWGAGRGTPCGQAPVGGVRARGT